MTYCEAALSVNFGFLVVTSDGVALDVFVSSVGFTAIVLLSAFEFLVDLFSECGTLLMVMEGRQVPVLWSQSVIRN